MSEEGVQDFQPNADDVKAVVTAIEKLLAGPEFADMRALDILIGVCGYGDYLKAACGVTAIIASEEEDDVIYQG